MKIFLIVVLSILNGIASSSVLGLSTSDGVFWVYMIFTSLIIYTFVRGIADK